MARSEFTTQQRSRSRFVNRSAEFALLKNHLALTLNDPDHFAVFEIVGLGGIGKTRLISELRDEASSASKSPTTYWLNVSSEATGGALAPLRALRSQVEHDCILFDAATLVYWTDTGQQFPLATSSKSSNAALRAAEVGGGLAGIPLPLTFASDVYHGIESRFAKYRFYDKAEFEAIDRLRHRPDEILRRLPHYLAIDLLRRGGSDAGPLVIFYDSYAAQSPTTLAHQSPWLREFIGSLDMGLHVISTRESLRWSDDDWGDVTHHIALGSLPHEECRMMIRQRVGRVSELVETRLLEGSHGIPFFLEIGLDALENHPGPAAVTPSELPASPTEAVAHLLGHLDHSERQVAIALGGIQVFDRKLFVSLVSDLNLAASTLDFGDIVGWFFVEADLDGLYRVNSILSDYIRNEPAHQDANDASLSAASSHLKHRSRHLEGNAGPALVLFQALLSGWATVDVVPMSAVEELIEIGYTLYDEGFWIEVGTVEPQTGQPLAKDHPCQVVSDFFAALADRRQNGPGVALERLEALEPLSDILGQGRHSFELEVAYVSELTGNYAMARQRFHDLDVNSKPFDPRNRNHYRTRLYHADMLTMDGSFRSASDLLHEACELLEADRPLDWAEMVRHRGHVMRFSYEHEDAELLYLRALHATTSLAMIAKLQTNLAETYCWTDPPAALTAATTAIELHTERGGVLEITKCYSAMAIAHSALGNFEEGRSACRRAETLASEVRYPAGEAFAAQARTVVEARSGESAEAAASHRRLQLLTDALGTYGHLGTLTAVAAGDDLSFVRLGLATDWIGDDDPEDRIKTILGLPG